MHVRKNGNCCSEKGGGTNDVLKSRLHPLSFFLGDPNSMANKTIAMQKVASGGMAVGQKCVSVNWTVCGRGFQDPVSGACPGISFSIFLAHANGFCKEMWLPVVEEFAKLIQDPLPLLSSPLPPSIRHLHAGAPAHSPKPISEIARIISSSEFDFTSIDLPAHGDTQELNPQPVLSPKMFSWQTFGDGVADTISERLEHKKGRETKKRDRVVLGCGLSVGATSMILSTSRFPNFDGLVLIEPIIPSPQQLEDTPVTARMAQGALKRRSVFSSYEEIADTYKMKPVFQAWDERALFQYVHHGFRENSQGELELKCPKELESMIFCSSLNNTALVLKNLSLIECPVSLVHGEHTFISPETHFGWDRTIETLKNVNGYEIAETGHLVCMSHPRETALLLFDMVARFLGWNGAKRESSKL